MPLDLDANEERVVEHLQQCGFQDAEARAYTVILCRQYRAPREELVSALRYHAFDYSLADNVIDGAVQSLLDRGLLRSVRGLTREFIEARPDWPDALVAALGTVLNPDLAEHINESLKPFADYSRRERELIERLGWATWDVPRSRLREAIRKAKREIRLGVYSSQTVFDEIKEDIRDAWRRRPKLRLSILMFSPALAARMEGNPALARDVRRRTSDWRKLHRDVVAELRREGLTDHTPELEIRHIEDERMAAFHRVVLVDDEVWILNIHRPGVERGIEGIVYQGCSDQGRPSNLHNILQHYWDGAWDRAADPSRLWSHRLKKYRHAVIFASCVALGLWLTSYANKHPGTDEFLRVKIDWWGGAFLGIALAELYTNFASVWYHLLRPVFWIMNRLERAAGEAG